MSATYNHVQVLGGVGRDPETRDTTGGKMVVSFSVATNDGRGEREETNWHNVVCFGKLAEIAAQYVKKGGRVLVHGRLQYQSWESKDGQKKQRTVIVADGLVLCSSRTAPADTPAESAPAPGRSMSSYVGEQVDEDLPF